ncbi:polyubiquitin-like [Aegilops tauschii subsp. strangulata]|uniref:polyubiquitin-like n=1 Tax=Aegilops tauschii subsp. strangulata TaxID=200361 RepID=UPI00098B1597|nr:polyubiquitin-like [Aegilops tauschii subsp. strangulata]
MQIFVKTLADETILVNADVSDTIYNVKTRIDGELCDPRSQQCLMFDGKELEDGCTIADYNIEEDSTVQLALLPKWPPEVMQIFLKAPNIRLPIEVESADTIEDVKKRIHGTWGIPPQSQLALVFDGRQLEDGHGLDGYGVCMGSTLHLTLHGSGWMLISVRLPIACKNPIILLEICPRDTVDIFREKLQELKGITASEQRIIFRGSQLKDGLTLADCGVVKNLLLDVILRLRGTNCPGCATSIARQ